MPDAPFTALLVRFAAELRTAGLAVGSGDVLVYCSALARLDPSDLVDLYWAGRSTLVSRRDDIARYDEVFRRFFLGTAVGSGDVLVYCSALARLDPSDLVDLYWAGRSTLVSRRDDIARYDEVFRRFFLGTEVPDEELSLMFRASVQAQGALAIPAVEPGDSGEQEEAVLGWMASDVEALKHKSFAACTPEELAALRRIMARIRLTPPRRRTRRTAPARSSGPRPDPRRTVRESLRMQGEPARLYWRRRKVRLRPLVLILDISGSMADYSRSLLQFAHSALRSTGPSAGRVEVFCFGTRLTRVTGAMECRRPDEALERAARAAFDWDGGTRIGDSLDAFVRGWARRGLCRGGIVVVCSDGLDRGDPEVLAKAMERLDRLCHRIVWLNPHKGDDRDFRPNTLGMMVAAPHIDLLLSGHDLASLVPPAGLAEPAQGRRPVFPAEHAGDDGGRAAHRPAAVRPRSGQPGKAGRPAARTQLSSQGLAPAGRCLTRSVPVGSVP